MNKLPVFLAIALIASLSAVILYRSAFPALQQVDLRLKDVRFQLRGQRVPDQRVVIAAIDGSSIREIGRWPWSREVTARLLAGLTDYGAKVVALDMVFSEPQGDEPDAALAKAVQSSGTVVLGYFFRNDGEDAAEMVRAGIRRTQVKLLRLEDGVTVVPIPEFTALDATIPLVGAAAYDQGFFNVIPDDDGLYRSVPLLALYDGDVYASLSLKALAHYLGEELRVDMASFGVRGIRFASLAFPVDEGGELPLNYYGPTGTVRTVSAADVLQRRLPAGALRGALVFVGATEKGIYDLRASPFDPALPGVELHATVAANALDGRFLTRDGRTAAADLAAIFLLPAILALLLSVTRRTMAGLGWFAFCAGGWLFVNYAMFRHYAIDLSIIYPLTPVFLTYLGGESYRTLVVERTGRYLKKAFSSYVSPELVEQIVRDPQKLRLGGEQRDVTILFSDIRGFTTISETLAPEELVTLLNDYLSPMTRIVLEERGTLDKFVGDALMAIFNAPLDLPGHPARACRAAMRMLERLRDVNALFGQRGLPHIRIGIGIHTGRAVVGNMGNDFRFDYTAIGDTVNLAARLEGLTKHYGAGIFVSGSTREAVGDEFVFREVDQVRGQGKEQAVVVYELMVEDQAIVPSFSEALLLYRDRDFAGALRIFGHLAESNDPVSALYAERCREFLLHPPVDDWDGVYAACLK